MKFFTFTYNGFIEWPYLMVKLSNFIKMTDNSKSNYEEIMIDPGVYDLKDSDHFSWEGSIDIKEFLDSLKPNEFFSFDYPGDMNPKLRDHFLERSWDNAIRYCYHPQYIVAVQYPFNNYWWFTYWFDKYRELPHTSGILGIGNLCKQRGCNEFVKHALDYIILNLPLDVETIHIYGPNKTIIKYIQKLENLGKVKFSIDSRKWEYYKPTKERPFWFHKYLYSLREMGVIIKEGSE